MKKPNITEGEWECGVINNGHKHFKDYSHYVSVPEKELVVCDMLEGEDFGQAESNAKAISAVPDMIDALINAVSEIKELHRMLREHDGRDHRNYDATLEVDEQVKALKKAGVEL